VSEQTPPGQPGQPGPTDPRSAGIRLRHADPDDLDQIFAIEVDVFESDAWSRDLMHHELVDKNCHYVVAVTDAPETIVGYGGVLAPRGSGDADIQTIATVPAARGRGVGRVIMNELIVAAREARAQRVFLEVRADNPIAMGLYRSLGFAEIGVREGYYQPDNVDAVIMRLDLGGQQ
jgi:ribosomal-protein-alanine acetyltransferase